MDIFRFHREVMEDYQDFVRSFVNVADPRLREFVDRLLEEQKLWPEPLIQLSPAYQRGKTVDDLAEEGLLHEETARIFRRPDGSTYRLYLHQELAIRKALAGESFVLSSGTGSGKTFCYFIPIVDLVARNPGIRGPVAFIIYPMNALVNSQLQALRELSDRYTQSTGRPFPLRFARYTGETPEEERNEIRQNPPHLLLTNYVMAELLLDRPEDCELVRPRPEEETPFFLVFDELHTYRGRQGADVAMLVRRLRARMERKKVVHIGTSATLIAHRDATPEERREVVAEFASRFFGVPFNPTQVIEETLEPATVGGPPTEEELRNAISGDLPADPETLRRHPLARWLEYTLGIEQEADGRYRRRAPRPLSEAAEELAGIVGAPVSRCLEILQQLLSRAAELNRGLSEPFFAFKLHQFISQGRAIFGTLEPPESRRFSAEGQVIQGRPLFPLRFCRVCGQDYYWVLRDQNRFYPHPLGGELHYDVFQPGYLTFADWSEDEIPDDWLDANGRPSRTWRDRVPQAVWVRPDGTFSTQPVEGAQKAWWQGPKFWLCLRCGEYYTQREAEFTKLSPLSSEGRSSATTILAATLLRHAARSGIVRDKLLTFTDSRQDASLQAGHFNDFVHMAVLRSALYAALQERKELRFHNVAKETVARMGLEIQDIAGDSSLDPDSPRARLVRQAFQDLVEYRLYGDLRRSWRVVQPNLEDVGLLKIEYEDLDKVCARDELWQSVPVLCSRSPEEREEVVRAVLDHFRKHLAIQVETLEEDFLRNLKRRAQELLNEFWGIDPEAEVLMPASWFVWSPPGVRVRSKEEWRKLTRRTALGRYLVRVLGLTDLDSFWPPFLDLLVRQGYLRRDDLGDGVEAYRLQAPCLIWCLGDGTPPPPDPVYAHSTRPNHRPHPNRFYQRFYREAARELASMEAREHTAQVVAQGERERRERRFRWLREDQQDPKLGRRLPYLVCSPTMELGIDIADLDMVHMRNVPPTPANYAQRSGRAGRQGQPGLIFTYCSAGSSHDQYFFRNPSEIVAGAVRAPRLDIANEALVRAHIQAEWLAQVALPLRQSIEEVLDTEREELPLREGVKQQIVLGPEGRAILRGRIERILRWDQEILRGAGWFREEWIDRVIEEAPRRFDSAFNRWRELYRSADEQLKRAQEQVLTARGRREQEEALRLQREALRQKNLLVQEGVAREESDFYPYRYLASEGFLPGYNFPALPVRAWVPRGEGEFISRPRSLAIFEFAPHNIVYHEGAKWQVYQFQLPPGGLEQRTRRIRLCYSCGGYSELGPERCPVCNSLFNATNSEVPHVLDLSNVRLQRRERITCNEEERLRIGYLVQVAFRFAPDPSGVRKLEADAQVGGNSILRLVYGPAATLLYLNRGWRGRPEGFNVDLATGELVRDRELEERAAGRSSGRTDAVKRLALCTWETQNLLLIYPQLGKLRGSESAEASLIYALKRGIEQVFQLEERELGVQRVGAGEHRALLFYEAAEGGLGVLRRLVEEPEALAEVAREALRICHYDEKGRDLKEECGQACYECLLSYTNQSDALLLDRRRIRDVLIALSGCRVASRTQGKPRDEHFRELLARTDSELERKFLRFLFEHNLRLPDEAQKSIREPRCIADFFYEPNVVVFCDGPPHEGPDQRRVDERIRRELRDRGFRVISVRWTDDLGKVIEENRDVFGGTEVG